MKVAVIGTGYVGLVTGTCLAESGNEVVCVDNNATKVEMLRGGGIPIYEPGLEELVKRNAKDGRLTFTSDLANAITLREIDLHRRRHPPMSEKGDTDLSAVWAVTNAIGNALKDLPKSQPGERVIVVKSTVPVGTNSGCRRSAQRPRRRPCRCGEQPGVPQGRGRDQRLHEAGPRGGGRAASRRGRTCSERASTPHSSAPSGRSWS